MKHSVSTFLSICNSNKELKNTELSA